MPTSQLSEIFNSLSQVPLGAGEGEQALTRPFNAGPRTVMVYVRNWSAVKKRRVLKEAVSFRRGGDKQVAGPLRATGESIQGLRERAKAGEDVNWYVDEVREQPITLRFDGRDYVIPARDAEGEPAPKTLVPEGVWDLYCGNYERMRNGDERDRADEIGKLQNRVRNFRCEGPDDDSNPFGVLEFIREEIAPQAAAANFERVYADDLMEV